MTEPTTIEERLIELESQLTERDGAIIEQLAEIERLKPLAEQGEQYRADLIEQVLAEGVRANGEDFPTDAYREILKGASLENIKVMREQYAAQARKRLGGGRQTVDGDETEPGAPSQPETVEISNTPAAAFVA